MHSVYFIFTEMSRSGTVEIVDEQHMARVRNAFGYFKTDNVYCFVFSIDEKDKPRMTDEQHQCCSYV